MSFFVARAKLICRGSRRHQKKIVAEFYVTSADSVRDFIPASARSTGAACSYLRACRDPFHPCHLPIMKVNTYG